MAIIFLIVKNALLHITSPNLACNFSGQRMTSIATPTFPTTGPSYICLMRNRTNSCYQVQEWDSSKVLFLFISSFTCPYII
uniref:Uncharacterized protein n=1 Tax=Rhizophora mucronata TaxID=61149 RepID=A0A2P2JCG3_RHIMU